MTDQQLYFLEVRVAAAYAKRDRHAEDGNADLARFYDDQATALELTLAEAKTA